MKRTNVIYLATLLIVIALTSCGSFKKMKPNHNLVKYTVTPNPVEMHGDEVSISVSGKFPEKYFDKSAVIEATPYIKSANGTEIALKPVKLQGEKAEDNGKVIKYAEGGSFSYSDKVPFSEDMKNSIIEIRIKASRKGKEVVFDPLKIADGVMATSTNLKMDSKVVGAKDKFVRITSESKKAQILFNIQQANIQGKELRAEDVKAFEEYVKDANANERKELKGLSLEAYASPDGGVSLNEKLANNRAKNTEKYIKRKFKKVDAIKGESFVKSTPKGSDWEGFKSALGSSDVADKDLILRVLSMHSDPEVRNKEMHNLSKVFDNVAKDVLPQLRRSVFSINVDLIGYSDEELKTIADTKPDSLKPEELLKAAALNEGNLEKQLSLYKEFVKLYASDWRGQNNVGYTNFLLGNYAEAKQAFEDAKAVKANSTVFNNLGACALKDNDFDKAEEYFTSAAGAGKELDYNLGIVAIKKGQYKEAVGYFGSENTANAGLAKILGEDLEGAIKVLDAADQNDATVLYLKAVCGARKGDTDMMYNNLRSAIGKDSKLNLSAKNDVEFIKYRTDDTFTSIVK